MDHDELPYQRGPLKDLTPNVLKLGVVSLLADISSEMLYPLIPVFLTQVLGAPIATVGVIEGFAEAISSGLKGYFGRLSDRYSNRRAFVFAGYGVSAIAKPVIALAQGWTLVLLARSSDRLGKALRSGPRDALLADSVESAYIGKAFGWHRALDTVGAILGPLFTLPFLQSGSDSLRSVFLWALIPGLISAGFVLLVREQKSLKAESASPRLALNQSLPKIYWSFFWIWGLFSVCNSSDMFLILRAQNLGLSLTHIILVYTLYNSIYALSSPWLGQLSDKLPRKWVLTGGLMAFMFVYAGMALASAAWQVIGLYSLYGLYAAATDGVGKAMALDFTPKELRATGLGYMGAVTSFGTLFASITAGFLWSYFGPWAPFAYGALGAGLAAVFLQRKIFA